MFCDVVSVIVDSVNLVVDLILVMLIWVGKEKWFVYMLFYVSLVVGNMICIWGNELM